MSTPKRSAKPASERTPKRAAKPAPKPAPDKEQTPVSTPPVAPPTLDAESTDAPANPGVQAALDKIMPALGEDGSRVRVLNAGWERFLQEGVVITPHFHRWRAKVALEMEDLGITFESDEQRDSLKRTLSLGSRRLLPVEYVEQAQTITDRARYALNRSSFKTHWGAFVHQSRYPEWAARNREIHAEYMALLEEILTNWEALMQEVAVHYNVLGLRTYQQLSASRPAREGRLELPPVERFISDFVIRMMASVPTPDQVRASWSYDWDVRFLPLAQQVAEDRAAADSVRTLSVERARAQAESEMLLDVKRTHARDTAEGLERFVADVQGKIRGEIYDVTLSALESLKSGKSSGNATRGLKTLVESVTRLKFWDDEQLDAQLRTLETLAATPAKSRDDEQLSDVLRRLGAESRLILTDLERAPARSGRDAGIPDEVPALEQLLRTPRAARTPEPTPIVETLDDTPKRRRGKKAAADAPTPDALAS